MADIRALVALLRSERLTQTKLADSTGVLLDVEGLQVYSLNETGMFLVEAMRLGASTLDELVSRLMEAFEVDEAGARRDVTAFLEGLSACLPAGYRPG